MNFLDSIKNFFGINKEEEKKKVIEPTKRVEPKNNFLDTISTAVKTSVASAKHRLIESPIGKIAQGKPLPEVYSSFKGSVKESIPNVFDKSIDEKQKLEKYMNVALGFTGAEDFLATKTKGFISNISKAKTESDVLSHLKSAKVNQHFNADEIKTLANTTDEKLIDDIFSKKSSELESFVNPQDPFYNIKRLNIPKEAKTALKSEIEALKPEVEKLVGKGPLTHKEIIDYANESGKILQSTAGVDMTKEFAAAMLNTRREIARMSTSGKMTREFLDLVLKDKSAGTDIARLLESRKTIASPTETNAMENMLHEISKLNKNADDLIKASEGVDFNDERQAADFFRKFVKPKLGEWVDLIRYNSMLSSPKTHLVNLVSNLTGGFVVKPITALGTGVVDSIKSALGGGKRTYFTRESTKYLKGATKLEALTKARQDFADVMSGKTGVAAMDIRRIPLGTGKWSKVTEKVLGFPMKLLEASDRFLSALIESGATEQLKYRAMRGGETITARKLQEIAGQAKYESAKTLFRKELVNNENGPVLNALGRVAQYVEMARNSESRIISIPAKFTFPFVRTATNIINTGLEWNPLTGWATIYGAKNKTEQIAKAAMGTVATLGIATMLGSDRLTFSEPRDATQKAAFREAGRKPYSVKIGDKWYSYQRLHPAISFNFALAAAIDTAIQDKAIDESTGSAILSAFAKYGNFITDQSFVKNIGDFVNGFNGDPEGFAKLAANYPTQLIPFRALGSWIERLIDPVQRKADTDGSVLDKQMQQIMAQIPGLATKVPARVGATGEPIANKNRLLNAFLPVDIGTETPEQRKEYQAYQDVKKVKAQELKTNKEINKEVTNLVESMKGRSEYEKQQILKDFLTQHPEPGIKEKVISEVKRVKTEIATGKLTQSEKTMKSLGVTDGARAKYIFGKIQSMDAQEKQSYLKNLVTKKIITNEVADQLRKLRQQSGQSQ